MRSIQTTLSGWGRYPSAPTTLFRPERYRELGPTGESCIARGLGRSYGDASFDPEGATVLTTRLDRLLELDPEQGLLRAEAGASVDELLELLVPRGWFLPVVPGTRRVTLGGCVAADVHGKNQHGAGCFGDHVRELELILADGRRVRCSAERESELFRATVGGMGLTGIIGTVTLQLAPVESPWMRVTHRTTGDLAETFAVLGEADAGAAYSVAWLDALSPGKPIGRGIVSHGEHAEREAVRDAAPARRRSVPALRVPLDAPGWLLNRRTMALYNRRHFRRFAAQTQPTLSDYRDYFFPLDRIGEWNRLYGRHGFLQYQFLVPDDGALERIESMLQWLTDVGHPPYLAVLKRFARPGPGLLSFARPGYTLALDFPFGDGAILAELRSLDAEVLAAGGRVYLAKDARLDAETFRAMYPSYGDWLAVKQRVDPEGRFRSGLSRRLRIGEAP